MTEDIELTQTTARMLNHVAGRKQTAETVVLRPLPSNPTRRDRATRRMFVVETPTGPAALLIVGHDLTDLEKRTRVFSNVFPELACPILTSNRENGRHLLLTEYFDGLTADKAFYDPAIGEAKVLTALSNIAACLRKAETPSTAKAARLELVEFNRQVAELSLWTNADRAFLSGVVFPFLEAHLLNSKPRRRATNGDLILRNILINSQSGVRIVDYEQTSDTHFFAEDWLRLGYWDTLPPALANLAQDQADGGTPLQVYFILKQLVWETRLNITAKAHDDARFWCTELRRIFAAATTELRHSQLWQSNQLELESGQTLQTQLFWMTESGWSAERSLRAEIPTGQKRKVTFDIPAGLAIHALRFDPAESACTLAIHEATVTRLKPQPEVAWFANNATELARFVAGGDAFVRLPTDAEYIEVHCFGNDPQLYLHDVGTAANLGLRVEIVLSSLPMSRELANGLRQEIVRTRDLLAKRFGVPLPTGDAMLEKIIGELPARIAEAHQTAQTTRDLLGTQQSMVADLQKSIEQAQTQEAAERLRTVDKDRDLAAGLQDIKASQTEMLRIMASREEIHEAREIEHRRTLVSVASLKTALQATEANTTKLHEYLTGHSQTIDRLELLLRDRESWTQTLVAENARQREALENAQTQTHYTEDQLGRTVQEVAAATATNAVLRTELAAAHAHRESLTAEVAAQVQAARMIASDWEATIRQFRTDEEKRREFLARELETAKAANQKMTDSISWWITTPFRRVFSWFTHSNR